MNYIKIDGIEYFDKDAKEVREKLYKEVKMKKIKIVKFHWVTKGSIISTWTPFGRYFIRENFEGKKSVYFNTLLISSDLDNSAEAKKVARKDFKQKVRDCIVNE